MSCSEDCGTLPVVVGNSISEDHVHGVREEEPYSKTSRKMKGGIPPGLRDKGSLKRCQARRRGQLLKGWENPTIMAWAEPHIAGGGLLQEGEGKFRSDHDSLNGVPWRESRLQRTYRSRPYSRASQQFVLCPTDITPHGVQKPASQPKDNK